MPILIVAVAGTTREDRDSTLLAAALSEQLAATLSLVPFISVTLARPVAEKTARVSMTTTYRLSCSVSIQKGLVLVVIRLVAADGRNLWGETFQGTYDGLFALRSRVASRVLEGTRAAIMTAEIASARARPPEVSRCRDLVLGAMPLVFMATEAEPALDTLYRAMELDPGDALAAALAAWCHAQRVTPWNENSTQDQTHAQRLAKRAVVLDPADPLVLVAQAGVCMMGKNFNSAEVLVRDALARDPACAWAWERRGWLKLWGKNFEEAIPDFEQALMLKGPEADGASSLLGIGEAHWCANRPVDALPWLSLAAARRPGVVGIQAQLASCRIKLGDKTQGNAMIAAIRQSRPELTASHVAGSFWLDKPCPTTAEVLSGAGLPP